MADAAGAKVIALGTRQVRAGSPLTCDRGQTALTAAGASGSRLRGPNGHPVGRPRQVEMADAAGAKVNGPPTIKAVAAGRSPKFPLARFGPFAYCVQPATIAAFSSASG